MNKVASFMSDNILENISIKSGIPIDYQKLLEQFNNIDNVVPSLISLLKNNNLLISTMESCTSGLVASTITDFEGASAVLKYSLVTYSNQAKIEAGVPETIIDNYGVYSIETAENMASALLSNPMTNIGIGVTGTFANADPANADSVPGIIYASIQFNTVGSDSYNVLNVTNVVDITLKIDINKYRTRHKQKEYVTQVVLAVAFHVLSKVY